eukprot:3581904-Rhodomonas_salina.2
MAGPARPTGEAETRSARERGGEGVSGGSKDDGTERDRELERERRGGRHLEYAAEARSTAEQSVRGEGEGIRVAKMGVVGFWEGSGPGWRTREATVERECDVTVTAAGGVPTAFAALAPAPPSSSSSLRGSDEGSDPLPSPSSSPPRSESPSPPPLPPPPVPAPSLAKALSTSARRLGVTTKSETPITVTALFARKLQLPESLGEGGHGRALPTPLRLAETEPVSGCSEAGPSPVLGAWNRPSPRTDV